MHPSFGLVKSFSSSKFLLFQQLYPLISSKRPTHFLNKSSSSCRSSCIGGFKDGLWWSGLSEMQS